MALNLEEGKGLAFPKISKAGNKYYEGEAILNGQRIKIYFGCTTSKAGKDMAWASLEDYTAAELAKLERRREELQNRSEKPELRDEVSEKPDRTEKAVPSNKRRKVA